jgi:hypothetical protein
MVNLAIIPLIAALLVVRHVWFKRDDLSNTKKVVWTILAFLFSIGTAITYFLFFKNPVRQN